MGRNISKTGSRKKGKRQLTASLFYFLLFPLKSEDFFNCKFESESYIRFFLFPFDRGKPDDSSDYYESNENKEYNFCYGSRCFCDPSKSEYRSYKCDNKKYCCPF
jgi:hypothetical protein